ALHQLRLLEWMATTGRKRENTDAVETEPSVLVPRAWDFTRDVKRYAWQEQCVDLWLRHGRGTVKVVTGGGKTLLGLAIAQAIQTTVEENLDVAIVVPTIVLMHQWRQAILDHGNIPAGAIGRLGGG